MIDREKVVKGLLCIKGDYIPCASCKYANADGYGRGDRCKKQCASDAIALLREQPEQKHGHWIEYPKCLEYDGALDDTYIVCSACEHVFNVIDNCTELFDYCPKCGAKMNEENEKEK